MFKLGFTHDAVAFGFSSERSLSPCLDERIGRCRGRHRRAHGFRLFCHNIRLAFGRLGFALVPANYDGARGAIGEALGNHIPVTAELSSSAELDQNGVLLFCELLCTR